MRLSFFLSTQQRSSRFSILVVILVKEVMRRHFVSNIYFSIDIECFVAKLLLHAVDCFGFATCLYMCSDCVVYFYDSFSHSDFFCRTHCVHEANCRKIVAHARRLVPIVGGLYQNKKNKKNNFSLWCILRISFHLLNHTVSIKLS